MMKVNQIINTLKTYLIKTLMKLNMITNPECILHTRFQVKFSLL